MVLLLLCSRRGAAVQLWAGPHTMCLLLLLSLCCAACDLAERSRTALQTACQHEGFRGIGGCPLTLSMHGGCGGAKLQVGSHGQSGMPRRRQHI
jgi:hypothetical protein